MTRCFPPAVGGMQRFAADLYQTLLLQPQIKLSLLAWGGSNLALPLIIPYFTLRASWQLLTGKIDIIHSQDGVLSIIGALLKVVFRKPLVVVIHGLDVTHPTRLYQALIRRSLNLADHIICISQAAQEAVLARGIAAERISVVPLGITDDLHVNDRTAAKHELLQILKIKQPNTQILLSVGRLVPRKGLDWFIGSVLPNLQTTENPIVLVLAGEGAHRTVIEAAIAASGADNVYLLGRVDDHTLQLLYNGADIFVMPNVAVSGDMEGFGRVVLEAAVCELPVVAAALEGITEALVDGKNGILVPSANAAAFITAIDTIIADPPAAKLRAKRARQFSLEHFAWPAVANQYVQVYKRLIDETTS